MTVRTRHLLALGAFVVLTAAAVVARIDVDFGHRRIPILLFVMLSFGTWDLIRRRTELEPGQRLWIYLLGSALAVLSVSQVVTFVVEFYPRATYTMTTPATPMLIYGYLVGTAGVFTMPHLRAHREERQRLLFDGLISGVATATIFWYVAADLLLAPGLPPRDRVTIIVFHVVETTMLVVLITAAIRRSAVRTDRRLLLIIAAMALITMHNVYSAIQFSRGPLTTYDISIAVFACGTIMAALLLPNEPVFAGAGGRRKAPPILHRIPVAVVAILVFVVAIDRDPGPTHILIALVGGVVLIALLVGRLLVTISEVRRVADERHRQTIGAIGHEVKNPLAAAVGMLEMLERPELSEDDRVEFQQVALDQVRYAVRMINDLAAMVTGRIESIQLHPTRVRLADIIAGALRDASTERAEVEVEEHLELEVDPDRMRQVFVNLLTNARRYGRGRILVTARLADGSVQVEVHDDGEGVSQDEAHAIWEWNHRGKAGLAAAKEGTGLGLTLVDTLVTRHGGSIAYRQSERLGGACFVVRLPAAPERQPSLSAK